jgi:Ca2+-transporting ATPase
VAASKAQCTCLVGLTLPTLTFFALLAAILALVVANRSFGASLRQLLPRHNPAFGYIATFVLAGSAPILIVPAAQAGLRFTSLSPLELGLVALTGLVLLFVFEVTEGKA